MDKKSGFDSKIVQFEEKAGKKERTNKKIILTASQWAEFKKLCGLQCSKRAVASWFGVSEMGIDRLLKREGTCWEDFYEEHRQSGLTALRNKQYEVAMNGNSTMLIWLGKQWLQQRDYVSDVGGKEDSQLDALQRSIAESKKALKKNKSGSDADEQNAIDSGANSVDDKQRAG